MEIIKYNKIFGKNTKKFFIEIKNETETIGQLKYGYFFDVLNIFDEYIPITNILKNYPNNKTIYIDIITVIDKFKGNGYSKLLLEEFIKDFNNNKTFDSVTLTVNPFQYGVKQKLSKNILEKFYYKFGFRSLPTLNNEILMILKKI